MILHWYCKSAIRLASAPLVIGAGAVLSFGALHSGFRNVYGLLLVREGFHIRYRTRMYIRLFIGDAISQPSMYAHPSASMGRWTQWPQYGSGFTGADIFYLIMVSR